MRSPSLKFNRGLGFPRAEKSSMKQVRRYYGEKRKAEGVWRRDISERLHSKKFI